MKWIDYREKLGIGFNDEDKFNMLMNKIDLYIDRLSDFVGSYEIRCKNVFDESNLYYYFDMVGEKPIYNNLNFLGVKYSFNNASNTTELISKYVALINTAKKFFKIKELKTAVMDALTSILDDLNIQIEILKDGDGVFIFPKGAKELDDALVSQPLEWLSQYPSTRKLWIEALKLYADTKNSPTDIADKFRKSLEDFFQTYFGGSKTLENYKSDYGTKLKENGIPKEIVNNFETLLQAYTNFMNSYAKHHDKTERNILEYIMYLTGNIIRLLITLKKEEK